MAGVLEHGVITALLHLGENIRSGAVDSLILCRLEGEHRHQPGVEIRIGRVESANRDGHKFIIQIAQRVQRLQ